MWFQRLVEIDDESKPEILDPKESAAIPTSRTKKPKVLVSPADFQRVRLMRLRELKKPVAEPGDAVLIRSLGGGKAPQEIAKTADHELLRSGSDEEEMIAFDPDNDDVVLRDIPPPIIRKPKHLPTLSPPSDSSEVSTPPVSPSSPKAQKRQPKVMPTPGDWVLMQALGGGKAPQEIVETASQQILWSESDDEEIKANNGSKGVQMPIERLAQSTELEALAGGALRAFNATEILPTKLDILVAMEGSVDDHRHISPRISSINNNHELAPIQATSLKAKKSTNVTLPSVLSQLGDLIYSVDAATAAADTVSVNGVHRQPISAQSPRQPPLFRVSD
jgi:hypothetical protein